MITHLFRKGVLLLAAVMPLFASCDSAGDELVSAAEADIKRMLEAEAPVLTLVTREPTGVSVVLETTISGAENYTIKQRGVLYSTVVETPEIGLAGVTRRYIIDKTDVFSYTLQNLKSGTTYYTRSYIILSTADTLYSNVVAYVPETRKTEVQTLPVFNRVKRAAIVCGRFTQTGDEVLSYGVCLSENPCPTPDDGLYIAAADTATDEAYHGIFGVFFDDLKANTLYHVRACVISATDTVYGNDRVFRTTQGGTFNYTFCNREGAEEAGAYERIVTHVDSALYYYRNYTNLSKFLWVNYSPGTPTADCNIEGWMNVGAVARYQWVGTIQHEMCHGLGVGTASNWGSFSSPWDKEKATLTLRVMMKDMSMTLFHDKLHFWPGGINQQEEVTQGTENDKGTYTLHNALMLKANALIINAMREDGLTSY